MHNIIYSDVKPVVFHNFQITEAYLANSLKSKLQTNVIGVISNTQASTALEVISDVQPQLSDKFPKCISTAH